MSIWLDAETLLRKKEVHVTAYSLEKMLVKSKVYISRATIYNNLNELSSKGFLKKVINTNKIGRINVKSVTKINSIPSSE